MKNKVFKIIAIKSFKQKKKLNIYLMQSKVFWKEVADNYKRINSLL